MKRRLSQIHKDTSPKGKNSPKWNPNKTDEEREIERKTPENKEWIKKILARDIYTCKCCGQYQGDIEVHHLDGYNWCKEKRYDVTNGITLCKTCHKNFHSLYGRGNNTKKQFEEWIGQAIKLLEFEDELPIVRKIYCIEEDTIYSSADELKEKWNMTNKVHIYDVCNYKNKSIYKKHILWLDEYEKMTKDDIEKYLEWCKPNKHDITGIEHPKSKTMHIYDKNNELLFTGNYTECGKWLYENDYSNSIDSARKTVSAHKNNVKLFKNLYFRT